MRRLCFDGRRVIDWKRVALAAVRVNSFCPAITDHSFSWVWRGVARVIIFLFSLQTGVMDRGLLQGRGVVWSSVTISVVGLKTTSAGRATVEGVTSLWNNARFGCYVSIREEARVIHKEERHKRISAVSSRRRPTWRRDRWARRRSAATTEAAYTQHQKGSHTDRNCWWMGLARLDSIECYPPPPPSLYCYDDDDKNAFCIVDKATTLIYTSQSWRF